MAKTAWLSPSWRPLSQIVEVSNPPSPSPSSADLQNGRVATIRRSTCGGYSLLALSQSDSSQNIDDGVTASSSKGNAAEDQTSLPIESPSPRQKQTTPSGNDDGDDVISVAASDVSDNKPLIANVKLLKKTSTVTTDRPDVGGGPGTFRRPRSSVASRSSLSVDDCIVSKLSRKSSTFNDLHPIRNVFIELGDYQTLLRPTAEETEEEADKRSDDKAVADQLANADESTATFIIPAVSQSSSYGEDTLRAMAVITEKFDSFRRRQLRVKSFMKTRSTRTTTSRDSGETATPRCSRDNSTASRSNSTARRSRQQRIAADHQLTLLEPPDVDGEEASEGGQLTAAEVERVRLFFSSLSTVVVVCRSLADLFVGACTAARSRSAVDGGVAKSDSTASCGWVHVLTGVPTLVLNTGAGGRRRRELSLVVADRGTGIPIWTDRINYMSTYRQVSPGVHTMHVSGGLTKRIRLAVFGRRAADEFLDSFRQMTSDPADELWNLSESGDVDRKKRKEKRERKTKSPRVESIARRRLSVADVSQPCNARWVTRVDDSDPNFRSAFAAQLPTTSSTAMTSSSDSAALPASEESFRPRLPTQ